MRIRYLLCATLALAPDGISHAATDDSQLEEIVVTARRAPEPRLNFAGSLSRLNAQAIDLEGATHYSELLNRVPGVYVQRGSGQESLVAIRSPVLNGAGSCGAFLMLEDGLPIRPVGFCNVNEMFELNTEQADAIEVIRGPGPAIYGANAMHGIVNVITPAAKELSPLAVALEGGTNDYKRVKFKTSTDTIGAGAGMYGLYTNDGGYRANSGDEEGKVNLLADTQLGSGTLRIRGAGTLLNQRTAGFVQGFDAYGNPALRTSNPNPEAFRDAWSTRLAAHWTSEPCSGCSEALHAIVRRSRMRFLQHFLLGEPLQDNSQTSFEFSGAVSRPLPGRLDAQIGFDAEAASGRACDQAGRPALRLHGSGAHRWAFRSARVQTESALALRVSAAPRADSLRLRKSHDQRQHRPERRALPLWGLSLQPAREPRRSLQQCGAQAGCKLLPDGSSTALRHGGARVSATGDH
ncbi:MAG: TonB-dependent receptor [Gammaproteobacteria bacterium]|nr:MAG: TonB-dependent receptor [Gammaproteobacteria bacterium]